MKNLLKSIHRTLKISKRILDKMKSLVSMTLTRMKVQQYNERMKSLLFLVNNFERQKQRYCVFTICSKLVFLNNKLRILRQEFKCFETTLLNLNYLKYLI